MEPWEEDNIYKGGDWYVAAIPIVVIVLTIVALFFT